MSKSCAGLPADQLCPCRPWSLRRQQDPKELEEEECGRLNNDAVAPTRLKQGEERGPAKRFTGPKPRSGRGPDLPYSSRMILSTLRTMLLVVSEVAGRHPPAFSADPVPSTPLHPKRKGSDAKGTSVGPGQLSAQGSDQRGARPASPALLQQWSVMIWPKQPQSLPGHVL